MAYIAQLRRPRRKGKRKRESQKFVVEKLHKHATSASEPCLKGMRWALLSITDTHQGTRSQQINSKNSTPLQQRQHTELPKCNAEVEV